MRKTNLSAQEIAEMDDSQRVEARKSGYSLMSVRDRGNTVLSNGVRIFWNIRKPENYTHYRSVPVGTVELDGKLYDAEELQKFLRWA